MSDLAWSDAQLKEVAATYGTPCYVYRQDLLEQFADAWINALGDRGTVCYAVKANSNLAVLQILARRGCGFDIVSEGELHRVIAAGGSPKKIVFSGVGKSFDAIRFALEQQIKCFNVESLRELDHINSIAESMGVIAPVSLRVNPNVDAKTHPYISTGLKENKFGIAADQVIDAYQHASSLTSLSVIGIDCHIGSQITEAEPFMDALEKVLAWVEELESLGITLQHIDLGGGLGVRYDNETPPQPAEIITRVLARLANRTEQLIFEPGRSITANAGVLLSQVLLTKHNGEHNFAIIDAAMNDLARPSLYQSWQRIQVIDPPEDATPLHWDIVGPICETGDFIAKQRPLCLAEQSLLVIHSAGAYGFSMASNYNSRRRAAEIILSDRCMHLARARESYTSLYRDEYLFEG